MQVKWPPKWTSERCATGHGLESLASPGTGQSEHIPSIKWISPATASGKHRRLRRFFCRSIVHMDSRVLERPPVANFSRAELQKERAAMARTSHFVQTLASTGLRERDRCPRPICDVRVAHAVGATGAYSARMSRGLFLRWSTATNALRRRAAARCVKQFHRRSEQRAPLAVVAGLLPPIAASIL